jgi:energy-coupling factor transport system permease protein
VTAVLPDVGVVRPLRPTVVHAGAWWLWAIGLTLTAARTTNPVLLALLMTVAGFVVVSCRRPTPWSGAYGSLLRIGLVVILFTLALRLLLGGGGEGAVVLRLPRVPLPSWLTGITLGGPVHSGPLLDSGYQALQVAALFACIGAANSLASPLRLLRSMPAALYEAGLVVTVALTLVPQAVAAAGRLRQARRLRGRATSGLAGLRGMAVPLLEEALDRSLALAAAMDSRGYGRRAGVSPGRRRLTTMLTLAGLVAVGVGCYGLFDAASGHALALPALGGGATLLACGLLAAGGRTPRTRYRPDRFGPRSVMIALSGIAAAAGTVGAAGLHPGTQPPMAPTLSVLAVLGLAVALAPVLIAPAPRDPA